MAVRGKRKRSGGPYQRLRQASASSLTWAGVSPRALATSRRAERRRKRFTVQTIATRSLAEAAVDELDDLVPAALEHRSVSISGRVRASRVQKALEVQVQADRIGGGDPQAVGDQGGGSRAARGDRDAGWWAKSTISCITRKRAS